MVTITLLCPYCESEKLVRNGHVLNGKQRYFCLECQR
jgi:transposase-like protein